VESSKVTGLEAREPSTKKLTVALEEELLETTTATCRQPGPQGTGSEQSRLASRLFNARVILLW